ncbi:MAG: 6-hydroxymethylpterin diphosphokinase MptE-like protein [Pseudomonadota bacterium]
MSLKDKHKGKPMLVVGNGPSLNKTPFDEFAHVPSIGMNKIDLLFEKTVWRPEVIVCINNIVAQQHQDVFAASDIPVFVGWKARRMMKAQNRDKINYIDLTASNDFATDGSRGFGSSATVSYIALQMAYWMGADPVIIFGIDHSFKFTGDKATYQKREGDDENHFHPDYFKSGSVWGTPDLDQSEVEYLLARRAFEADGRTVYDATIDGKLQIFPKITLDEAREMTRA